MTNSTPAPRRAKRERVTLETNISVAINLDGGPIKLSLNQGFFQHTLNTLAVYAGWGLELTVEGDSQVDHHHSVEDTGLVLGEALNECLGDFSGHQRFGHSLAPMDEALAEVALDVSRRPYLHFEATWPQPMTGDFDLCLVEEFWRALTIKAGWTLHIMLKHGRNSHHLAEAMFKSVGLAARQALAPRYDGPFSTKGLL
ncbi:MAG: imidazoleglycerol-phosphate dehydratase HisB [Deltaproteobacteria bacterium]|jgi:imidazoleglycerol-phosphate dehydratase|nr:imidazoleglycerol-phosphate dehydratase HisB [Deltaproteobacteria bacterium]